MDLYLVRHAVAEQRSVTRWPDDSERPLTENGATRFRSAARGLGSLVPMVDRVLSSSYARAWQTAEILSEEAHWPTPERAPALEADRGTDEAVELLERTAATSLALVGHQPSLSILASRLLTGEGNRVWLELKKGSAVLLELDGSLGPHAGVLRWSLSPRVLRRLDPRRA